MNHITEIVPDDMPEWAIVAMADGQFFRLCIERVELLEAVVKAARGLIGGNYHSVSTSSNVISIPKWKLHRLNTALAALVLDRQEPK